MILADLNGWETEKMAFSGALQRAIEFLKMTDLEALPLGRYDLEDGMYAQVQLATTVPKDQRKAEHHVKNIDIQMVISGVERHYVARQSAKNIPVQDLLAEKDYRLYDDVHDDFEIIMKPGMFVIYFPDDVHRPACNCDDQDMETKRIVIKINKNIL